MKPKGMNIEIYDKYKSDGFTDSDISRIWNDTLYFRLKMKINSEKREREITCSTYERAQNRLKREVDSWFKNR